MLQKKTYSALRALKHYGMKQIKRTEVRATTPLSPAVKEALRRANTWREQQQFAQALEELQRLAETFPNIAQIYLAMAMVYFDLRMQRKAHQMLAQAIKCDPTNPDAAMRLSHNILKKAKTPIRDSIGEIMLLARQFGFEPKTIIDVGVNTGTPGLFDFFPNAKLLMIDPIVESEPFMKHIATLYPDAHYELCAATAEEGEVTMSVFPSFGGSAVIEVVGRQAQSVDRKVPAHRIDKLVAKHRAKGPYVIKADTEGGELDVLAGATGILEQTELLILETRVRPYLNAPDLLTVTDKLREYGFLPYDFIDRNYNDTDGTLKQFDLVAVRRDGFFRTPEKYRHFVDAKPDFLENTVKLKLRSRNDMLKKIQTTE